MANAQLGLAGCCKGSPVFISELSCEAVLQAVEDIVIGERASVTRPASGEWAFLVQ